MPFDSIFTTLSLSKHLQAGTSVPKSGARHKLDLKFVVKLQFFQRQYFGNGCSLKKLTDKIIPLHFYLSFFSGLGVFHLFYTHTHKNKQTNKEAQLI